jgi:hypothetical protein
MRELQRLLLVIITRVVQIAAAIVVSEFQIVPKKWYMMDGNVVCWC